VHWYSVALAYASYLAVVGWLRPAGARGRWPLLLGAAVAWIGFGVATLRGWRGEAMPPWLAIVAPALVLLAGYWMSGLLFVRPDPRIEGWLRANSARIQSAQQRWFGEQLRLDALGHLTDMLARRMAFMPLVAGAKAKLGMPIEDLPREQLVLDSAAASARKVGLPEAATRAFFGLQIELSKAVQRRSSEPPTLDLAQQIRPALNELGDRILAAMAEARSAGQLANCSLADLDLLSPWLNEGELQQLRDSLRAFSR